MYGMLTAELPQMSIKGKIQPILRKLEALGGKTTEVLSGESVEIHAREAKISRMRQGVASFMSQWEEAPNKGKLLGRISQAKGAFEAKQAQYEEQSLRGDKKSLEAERNKLREEIMRLDMLQQYAQGGEKAILETRLRQINTAYNEAQEAIRTTKVTSPEAEFDAAQEAYQVALTGLLFAKNKEHYREDKKVPEGELGAYDTAKEARQIEGVLRAVNEVAGQHLHIGTGEGKSTVILPIATLVDAATNTNGKVVVGSANGTLVDELKRGTTRLADDLSATKIFADISLHNVTKEGKGKDKDSEEEDISKQMTKDVLLQGSVSKETRERQKSHFWKQFMQQSETDDLLIDRADKKEHKIDLYFGEEKDLVFKWMDDPKAFVDKCPRIFMDEAHVAYDKGTPYSKTHQSEAIGADDVKGGISNWLIHYIVAREIKETDVIPSGGGYVLTEDASAALDKLQLHKINPDNKSSYSRSFYDGVDIIIKTMGIDMEEGARKRRFARKLLTEMRSSLPHGRDGEAEGEQGKRDHIQSVGGEIAKFVRLRDKIFTEKAGTVVIRDAYIDELLTEHKYTPTAQAAVLAVTGIFEPIKRKVAYKTVTYPSFVNAIGDRLVALSGTLMHPNPKEKMMEKGSFATFLKTTTGCETCAISTPEMKPLPKPHLFEQTDEMYAALINDLKWEEGFDQEAGYKEGLRPTLLVDFNGLESATRTYKRMQGVYGNNNVRLLLSKPTGGDKEAEREYVRQLDEYRSELAQGKIKMLVSSGSAALGVNFERPDGTFPDMRTIMIGMPDSEERITQTIGRRRLKEGATRNHLWYLSLPDLEIQESLLERQTKKRYIGLEKSQQQMHTALLKVKDDPDKVFDLIKTLMRKMKTSRVQDEEMAIRYDTIINDQVIPYATRRLERHIASELLGYDAETTDRIMDPKNELETPGDKAKRIVLDHYSHTFGLPSTIHDDARSTSFAYALEQKKLFDAGQSLPQQFEEQMRLLRQGIFAKTPSSFDIDRYVDEWFEDSKKTVDDYAKLVEYAQNADKLVLLQDKTWASAFYIPAPVEIDPNLSDKYKSSTLIQTILMDDGRQIEVREVIIDTNSGKIERAVFMTHNGVNYVLVDLQSGDGISTPSGRDIVDIRMDVLPVTIGMLYGNGTEHATLPMLPYFMFKTG